MRIARTIVEVQEFRREAGLRSVGLVPTMGALHAGHASLVSAARRQNKELAVSIFVNPTQFGPGEDLARYPRTWDADVAMLEHEGVDLLFAPEPAEMYPEGFSTVIDVGPIAGRLDGASRAGHFAGVATVVAKLFQIVQPDRAYFGQKDAAQVAVLRKLVLDLAIPVDVVVCPTIRETDGLALSSRNRYLSAGERPQALVLVRALHSAELMASLGVSEAEALLAAARLVLAQEEAIRIDYLALVDGDTLEPVDTLLPDRHTLLAVAAWIGTTRLIDNTLLRPA